MNGFALTRFETEVLGNSEVPYSLRNFKSVW